MSFDERFKERARQMLHASGPWLDCPFCDGDEPARAWGSQWIPHEEDPTQSHQPGCLLRMIVGEK